MSFPLPLGVLKEKQATELSCDFKCAMRERATADPHNVEASTWRQAKKAGVCLAFDQERSGEHQEESGGLVKHQ